MVKVVESLEGLEKMDSRSSDFNASFDLRHKSFRVNFSVEYPQHLDASENAISVRIELIGKMQGSDSIEQERFQIRRLQISDNKKGFSQLLQQLTICDAVADQDFEERFQELAKYGDDHLICVIEDGQTGKIAATGSVFIEKKFIRNCAKVGHIEDVVVDSSFRGMHLGKRIVAFLTDHARSMGCYKVILDCSNENRPFYERCGYKQKEVQMVQYFI